MVDSRFGVVAGAGDIHLPIAAGRIRESDVLELGEVALGRRTGRQGRSGIAVFKSVSFAALDVVVAHGAATAATAQRLGTIVTLS